MTASSKPWFAESGTPFRGDEPFFFNTDDFPWVRRIEQDWEVIRDELHQLLALDDGSLQPYANTQMTSRLNQWKTFGMMFWTIRKQSNLRKCPKTWALLRDVPNICAISFNLLEPNTTIKPHNGDTNAIIRCHMGLEVPAGAPRCAFRVGTETVSWQEGKFFMFCDAHEHTAWNNTDRRRYVLVVDVMRQEYVSMKRAIVARVLASIRLAIYYQRHNWLRRFFGGKRAKALLHGALRIATYGPLLRSGA